MNLTHKRIISIIFLSQMQTSLKKSYTEKILKIPVEILIKKNALIKVPCLFKTHT